MPCGDTTTFPTDAVAKLGQAFVNKKFTTDLIPSIGDLTCYFAAMAGGGIPIPFPRPTFGAGPDGQPDEAEVEKLGHMMVACADAHRNAETAEETGVKMAPNVAALPWGTILSVLFTILQGLLLAAEKPPVNPAR